MFPRRVSSALSLRNNRKRQWYADSSSDEADSRSLDRDEALHPSEMVVTAAYGIIGESRLETPAAELSDDVQQATSVIRVCVGCRLSPSRLPG